ncbi:MAG TPA: FliH/SctL family protein [Candidatus Binatia bacterium]|jgi:flagellar assembly protein FliH
MSSYEPSRRGDGPVDFAPLSGTRVTGTIRAGSVFKDFDGGASAEPAPAAPSANDVALTQARQAGYDEGVAAGRAALEAELGAAGAALTAAIEDVARFRGVLTARYQRELLELALGVAHKVVQRELAEHPEHWLGMIREAVLATLDRETIRLRVGPVLHRYLVEHLPRLRVLLEEVKELDLVEDVGLGETGCVVESAYGDLDVGVDSQINAIRTALTGTEA